MYLFFKSVLSSTKKSTLQIIQIRAEFEISENPDSETFSHVKISSTRLIAHLKAREKLSFTLLVADFRGFA